MFPKKVGKEHFPLLQPRVIFHDLSVPLSKCSGITEIGSSDVYLLIMLSSNKLILIQCILQHSLFPIFILYASIML